MWPFVFGLGCGVGAAGEGAGLVLVFVFVIIVVIGHFPVADDFLEGALTLLDLLWIFIGGEDGSGVILGEVEDRAGLIVRGVAGVGGGDLEGIEHAGCALGVEAVLAKDGENHGEGELDGVGVLQGREVEEGRSARFSVILGEDGFAANGVEFAGGGVVEDVGGAVERWTEGAKVRVDGGVVEAEGLAAE